MSVTGWKPSGTWGELPRDESAAARDRNDGRIVDFLLFAVLPMSLLQVRGLPVAEIAMGLALCAAVLRPARVRAPAWLVVPLLALMALMLMSAQLNPLIDPNRRLLHLGLYTGLAIMAAQGRFNTRSMAKGLAVGLLVSAGAYFFDYGTSYPGRLAGLMADPNSAGYLTITLGCLALAGMGASHWRVPLGLLLLVAVVLTYSRTSLLALSLIALWVVIGRRLAASLGSLLLLAMILIITNLPLSLRLLGPFSDRSGSDALRERITRLELLQVSNAPWYGYGPGTSRVEVQGEVFLFHNSYLALHNEAGRIGQVLLVAAVVFTLYALLRLLPGQRNPWLEGAIIGVSVCAVNLGEVLLELPTALALGLAAYHVRTVRRASPDDEDPASIRSPHDLVQLR